MIRAAALVARSSKRSCQSLRTAIWQSNNPAAKGIKSLLFIIFFFFRNLATRGNIETEREEISLRFHYLLVNRRSRDSSTSNRNRVPLWRDSFLICSFWMSGLCIYNNVYIYSIYPWFFFFSLYIHFFKLLTLDPMRILYKLVLLPSFFLFKTKKMVIFFLFCSPSWHRLYNLSPLLYT